MINYHHKSFSAIANSENGETSSETVIHYKQMNNILMTHRTGGKIINGQLIAIVNEHEKIDMRYHQVNTEGRLMTGICKSKPKILSNA